MTMVIYKLNSSIKLSVGLLFCWLLLTSHDTVKMHGYKKYVASSSTEVFMKDKLYSVQPKL